MANFLITVTCPVDPYPYSHCLIYGSFYCDELCTNFDPLNCA